MIDPDQRGRMREATSAVEVSMEYRDWTQRSAERFAQDLIARQNCWSCPGKLSGRARCEDGRSVGVFREELNQPFITKACLRSVC
jgi:hypothetical protein